MACMSSDALPPLPVFAPVPGRYRHYKGNEYEVLLTARHSEQPEEFFVVYRPLRGDSGVWVRPLEMFVESVETGDGLVPRFSFVGEA